MITLPVFDQEESKVAKILLAAKVASMMGRKMEEGDWSDVYCKAKRLPDEGWSNLNIDINHDGLGVEFKMLRAKKLKGASIKSYCGTTPMHPSATRSIRIDDTNLPSNQVMIDVLNQYCDLIDLRTKKVAERSTDGNADMRVGWLLWEDDLKEFLYFEEPMVKPDHSLFYAEWNETAAKGSRKPSKSLWIYEKSTNKKRYSVTTSAGVKIQPYFDVPPPNDPNLVYYRVQSEIIDSDTILLWVAAATAKHLEERLGSLEKHVVSKAVLDASKMDVDDDVLTIEDLVSAVKIPISKDAFDILISHWDAVSDDHRVQLLLKTLSS